MALPNVTVVSVSVIVIPIQRAGHRRRPAGEIGQALVPTEPSGLAPPRRPRGKHPMLKCVCRPFARMGLGRVKIHSQGHLRHDATCTRTFRSPPHDRKCRRSSRSRHVCRDRRLLKRGLSFGLRLTTWFPSTSGTAKHLAIGAGGHKRELSVKLAHRLWCATGCLTGEI